MEYVKLGSTGADVSPLCFGTWRFSKAADGTVETNREEAQALLDACAEHGVNFIDTANAYGDPSGTSERWIGEWLADRDREEYVIASKVYWNTTGVGGPGLSRKAIRAEIDGTLERLGTDYLDLYYIHRWDDATPILETMRTLTELVREGRVHYLGASSMAAWKLAKALWTSDVEDLERFEVTQPRFNAAYREPVADYLELCADQGLAVCPYSPLEGGFLTGKYDREGAGPSGSRGELYGWGNRFSNEQWAVLDAISDVADELDATPAQVALRWMIEREAFTCVPIIGARTPAQLEENVGALEIALTDDQRSRIDEAGEDV